MNENINKIIDVHCHILNDKEIENSFANKILNTGYDISSSEKALKIAENHDFIYAAVGLHPCHANKYENLYLIKEFLNNNKTIALGECGLDKYGKENQLEIFHNQIEIAKEKKKAMVIHSRGKNKEIMDILKKEKDLFGVLHCYEGEIFHHEILNRFAISFNDIIFRKKSKQIRFLAKNLPIENILFETDYPYLNSLKLSNPLKSIYFTAEYVAKIRNIDLKTIVSASIKNFFRVFKI